MTSLDIEKRMGLEGWGENIDPYRELDLNNPTFSTSSAASLNTQKGLHQKLITLPLSEMCFENRIKRERLDD